MPQLLGDVRGHRSQQLHHRFQHATVDGRARNRLVLLFQHDVVGFHQRGQSCVEAELAQVFRDALDGLVAQALDSPTLRRLLATDAARDPAIGDQAPEAVQETPDALQVFRDKRAALIEWPDEHHVQADGIGPVLLDVLVGRFDVAARLGHLLPVGAQHHALMIQAFERLVEVQVAHIAQRLDEEARVQQVHHGMFRAADVLIDGQPARYLLHAPCLLIVVCVGVAQEVPGRTDEGVHRIGLACGRTAADGAGRVQKLRLVAQRRLPGGLELHVLRQPDGQLLLRYGNGAMLRAVDDGDGRAPVPLAADQPVTQAIGDHKLADALLLQVARDLRDGLLAGRAAEGAGIDHRPLRDTRLRPCFRVARLLTFGPDDLDDGNAELARKLEVALVVGGNAHDRARAVAHQHVVGDPDGNLLAADRVGDVAAGEDARLLLLRTHALDLGHAPRLLHVSLDGGALFGRGDLLDQRMFGGQYEEGRAVNCVRACGEDRNLLAPALDLGVEANLRALAAPDPVALHGDRLFRPLDLIEVQQFFGIGGDAQ